MSTGAANLAHGKANLRVAIVDLARFGISHWAVLWAGRATGHENLIWTALLRLWFDIGKGSARQRNVNRWAGSLLDAFTVSF